MPDDDGVLRLEGVEHADEIADHVEDRVLIDRFGPVTLPIAAHVGCDRVVAGRRQRLELVAPGVPAFRKAVAEQHHRPLALLGDVEADAVRLDPPLRRLAHVIASGSSRLGTF